VHVGVIEGRQIGVELGQAVQYLSMPLSNILPLRVADDGPVPSSVLRSTHRTSRPSQLIAPCCSESTATRFPHHSEHSWRRAGWRVAWSALDGSRRLFPLSSATLLEVGDTRFADVHRAGHLYPPSALRSLILMRHHVV
jgi:hypothetical protein